MIALNTRALTAGAMAYVGSRFILKHSNKTAIALTALAVVGTIAIQALEMKRNLATVNNANTATPLVTNQTMPPASDI